MNNKPIKRWLVSCGAALALLLSFAPPGEEAGFLCVNPAGSSGCFSKIQSAVNAAASGRTIAIFPGTYFESVTISTDGLALLSVGSFGDAIIDPHDLGTDGIDIKANHVTINGLGVRNSTAVGINVFSGYSGTLIRRAEVSGNTGGAISINGGNSEVTASQIRGSSTTCVGGTADHVTIDHNIISQCGGLGIFLTGNDEVVAGNHISTVVDAVAVIGANAIAEGNTITSAPGSGIAVSGSNPIVQANSISFAGFGVFLSDDNATVKGNTVTSVGFTGLFVRGANPQVTGNSATGALGGDGFQIYCTGPCTTATVYNNTASKSLPDGFFIDASAPGMAASGNHASRAFDQGLIIEGTGIVLQDNQASDCGVVFSGESPAGFVIAGTNHTLENNAALRNGGDGFRICASNVTLTGNTANGNLEAGFDVESTADPGCPADSSGVALDSNSAAGNDQDGIAVESGASGTQVSGNTAESNRADFCNAGTGTVVGVNSFGTVGLHCIFD